MAHHMTWYKDEESWRRFREICVDKEQFGTTYTAWKRAVEAKLADAGKHGIQFVKCETDPELFAIWCKTNGHVPNAKARSLFLAISQNRTGDQPPMPSKN